MIERPTKQYQKGSDVNLGNFSSSEFDCKCQRSECSMTLINDDLIRNLGVLLSLTGDFEITSGYRCVWHNKDVGGVANSQHLYGNAVDIKSTTGYNGDALTKFAEKVNGFEKGGIGTAKEWVHLDVGERKARWRYDGHGVCKN